MRLFVAALRLANVALRGDYRGHITNSAGNRRGILDEPTAHIARTEAAEYYFPKSNQTREASTRKGCHVRQQNQPDKYLSLLIWLLPSCGFKRWALRSLGHHIAHDVVVGPTLVLGCGIFSLGAGTVISSFNIFRNLTRVQLDGKNFIGSWNQFTAAVDYQKYSDWVGVLLMKEQALITNRHYLDCSGQVILEPYATIGGIKCIIQSHELDFVDNTTKVGQIILGRYATIVTGCVMLKGSYLPDWSVLGAGSVMVKAKDGIELPKSSLYAGAPARFVKELTDLGWWQRDSYYTPAAPFDDTEFQFAVKRHDAGQSLGGLRAHDPQDS